MQLSNQTVQFGRGEYSHSSHLNNANSPYEEAKNKYFTASITGYTQEGINSLGKAGENLVDGLVKMDEKIDNTQALVQKIAHKLDIAV